MELTQTQRNKLMAAVEIVEHGDMAVLKKILEFQDILDSFIAKIESKLDSLSNNTDIIEILGKIKTLSSEINTVKANMPTMPDLSVLEAKISQVEASIPVIKDTILDTPLEIRDKLESIKTESEKLSIEAISELRKELDELKKKTGNTRNYALFGGAPSNGGRTVQAYDLSASLNGVLKSFVLPAFWRVLNVHSSSFPYVFRPTVDYTISGTTITFTSEIEASTTLSTGQSLIVLYAE